MAVNDYNLDPDLNTTISGINIAEGCPPSGINNAIRQLMADAKQEHDAVQTVLTEEVGNIREDTLEAARQATASGGGAETGTNPLPDPETVVHAVGEFWFTLDGSIPAGGLPHLGHLCSRATYGDFWVWREAKGGILTDEDWLAYAEANGGVCPYYSYGDGSTTFRTPKYDEAFLKVVAATANAGKYGAEGLPNITGLARGARGDIGNEGAFTSGDYGRTIAIVDATTALPLKFDASLSNPIYGASEHVTPKNVGVLVGVYAVGKLGVIGSTDAEALLTGMTALEANKASVDASNFSADGKSVLSGLGMPGGRSVSLTLGASGTGYTAPANGWFCMAGRSTGSAGFATLTANNMSPISSAGTDCYLSTVRPVRKGDVVTAIYSTFAVEIFNFYYAEGEEA